jgi:hypothetical protein
VEGIRHPFNGALYEKDASGHIHVTHCERSGLYRGDGSWVSGDRMDVDPQLCVWLNGPRRGSRHTAPPGDAPAVS